MIAIPVPDPLPPAITPPRTVIEFLIDQDLDECGGTGLVARTWRWILYGGGPGPISRMDWSRFDADGPPRPPPWQPKAPPTSRRSTLPPRGLSSTRPGSSAGYAPPSPGRRPTVVSPLDTGSAPGVTEYGSVTVTMRQVHGGD